MECRSVCCGSPLGSGVIYRKPFSTSTVSPATAERILAKGLRLAPRHLRCNHSTRGQIGDARHSILHLTCTHRNPFCLSITAKWFGAETSDASGSKFCAAGVSVALRHAELTDSKSRSVSEANVPFRLASRYLRTIGSLLKDSSAAPLPLNISAAVLAQPTGITSPGSRTWSVLMTCGAESVCM